MLPGALLAATGVLVTVLDPATGLMVRGLGPGDFTSPRPVESVRTADIPLAALLLVDSSSVGGVVRTAAAGIAGQLRPGDRMAVMTYAGRPTLLQPFTADAASVRKSVEAIDYSGEPRTMDALVEAIATAFPAGRFRRVVILLTAGIEGPSRAVQSEVILAAIRKGIALYPLYLHGSGQWIFRNVAKDTGGAMFWLREAKDPAAIYDSIRAPYLIHLGGGAVAIKVKGREKSFVSTLPWREP